MFTYPFRYVPSAEVKAAAEVLSHRLDTEPGTFAEGKMLGVLITDSGPLYAFSGLVGGCSHNDGFVPPIYDYAVPDGYFRKREAEISAMPEGPAKSLASAELQDWLFSQYKVRNALGEELSIKEIFAIRGLVPPGGTGECAAPKLLDYAFRNGLKPLSMGEFWYGASPHREVRESGRFYPSCFGKCGPLLTWMMRGLEVEPNPLDAQYSGSDPVVLFEDADIIVVDKPSGMLSVPGRTESKSLLEWLQERYGEVHSCHRLDMDTSGIIVYARNMKAKVIMEQQFACGQVKKSYKARLAAGTEFNHAPRGTIALPLGLDYYDRPRQIVSEESGRKAVTEYEVLEIFPNGEIDVRFTPLTGRSHQLRVHAAHTLGLGRPIKGDALYGAPSAGPLYLRAYKIEFHHPRSGEVMEFSLEPEKTI